MARTIRLINGKGDWTDNPPTGASDADLYQMANDFIAQAGVLDKEGGDSLVTESDTPGMTVKVAKGTIYVENSTWEANSFEPRYYQVVGDAEETLNIASNSSGSTRIDKICQKIDKITTPDDEATNVSPLVVVQGTPGGGAPATPDDHELLATVTVVDGETQILDADITDQRRQIYIDTKDINNDFEVIADAPTMTMDMDTKKRKFLLGPMTANRTVAITNAKEGDTIYFVIENDATARNPVWPSNVTWFGVEDDPDMSDYVEAGKKGAFLFICVDEDTPAFHGFFLGAEE